MEKLIKKIRTRKNEITYDWFFLSHCASSIVSLLCLSPEFLNKLW
jgi:hypothetical protein